MGVAETADLDDAAEKLAVRAARGSGRRHADLTKISSKQLGSVAESEAVEQAYTNLVHQARTTACAHLTGLAPW